MPRRNDIKKVMIIGSGPIAIGQACEFDYSRTQACKALCSLGYEIVLVNSNPATIMTDPGMADVTYIEPLNLETVTEIIKQERPDALLPNLGGQTGLNLSDYLVPLESIFRRLETAAQGDFVIVLYNPRSKKRRHQLAEAIKIVSRYRPPSTPAGIVTNAYRRKQETIITDLEHLLDHKVGMNTTNIIGNSTTFTMDDWLVTPRGYRTKYGVNGKAPAAPKKPEKRGTNA